jgi:hypothetical protein
MASPEVPASDDLAAAIAGAQAQLATACAAGPLRRDPYRFVLFGLSGALGVLLTTTKRWEKAVADVIAARSPLSPEERGALSAAIVEAAKEGARQAMRKEAAAVIRGFDRRLAARTGLAVAGAFILGSLATAAAFWRFSAGPFRPDADASAAWRELVRLNPDPRPALQAAEVRTDRNGRRYYGGVSLWLDPPASPPR